MPEESQVGQGVREFLRRHGGIGEHACAGMTFAYGVEAGLVAGQLKALGIPQIGRLRIQLRNERGRVGDKLRLPVPIPIDAMTVITNTFPVKDLSAPSCIAEISRALLRRPGTGPDLQVE